MGSCPFNGRTGGRPELLGTTPEIEHLVALMRNENGGVPTSTHTKGLFKYEKYEDSFTGAELIEWMKGNKIQGRPVLAMMQIKELLDMGILHYAASTLAYAVPLDSLQKSKDTVTEDGIYRFQWDERTHVDRRLPLGFQQEWDAATKMNEYWNVRVHPEFPDSTGATPNGAFDLSTVLMVNLAPTHDTIDDLMPNGRKKHIHDVGAVMSIAVDWSGGNINGYTGMFAGDSLNYGIMRASSASPISPDNFVPGISLKFFRSGRESANMFAMHDIDSQDTQGDAKFNFFHHDLCNHIPASANSMFEAKYWLLKRFHSVSNYPGLLGLSDVARFAEDGTEADVPHFPFALFFRPNSTLQVCVFPVSNSRSILMVKCVHLPVRIYAVVLTRTPPQEEFADCTDWTTSVAKTWSTRIGADQHLYDIYAFDAPESHTPVFLGSIRTTHKPVASKFADAGLHYRHQWFEEDLAIRPEWRAATNLASPIVAERFGQEGADYYEKYMDPVHHPNEPSPKLTYKVMVRTGVLREGDSKGLLRVHLLGSKNDSGPIPLTLNGPFERDSLNTFEFTLYDLGEVRGMNLTWVPDFWSEVLGGCYI